MANIATRQRLQEDTVRMVNNDESAWNQADVHFQPPGQNLGNVNALKIQARASVQFDGSWLHLRINSDDGEVISVPATAVDRVEWKPTA